MISKQILKKVKQIEIRTRGLVNNLFGGEYHSVFKGRGMTFSEVREYHSGEDIRLIDWNVTARTGIPFIKIFEEERELIVNILVDVSKSGNFGSGKHLKKEYATHIAAVLGFSAIKNNDKVGLILFSNKIEKFIPPKKGKSHILRIIRELLHTKSTSKGTSLKVALDFLLRVNKRKSVTFLISDFIDEKYWSSLKIVNRKHDLVAIHLYDPVEIQFPNIGLVKVEDNETGIAYWIDTSSRKNMNLLNQKIEESNRNIIKKAQKIGLDLISISTEKDFIEPLISLFRLREKRI